MRQAISWKTALRPTTSSRSGPNTDLSPSSSCSASTGGPSSGSSKSHRFSTSTRSAKRSENCRWPELTSAVERMRSASTNSRSASAVAAVIAPSMRTTPSLISSFASTDPCCLSAFAAPALLLPFLEVLLFEALLLPVAAAGARPAPPNPEPLPSRPPFCCRARSPAPSCKHARSFRARAATARSRSRWSIDLALRSILGARPR
mmetsp:Transcript_41827/g.89244  ORF Transcript_41827/g.89244 Transcript_41827/m.89244 type:complete len:204 (-) Transcript_41827:174-785(-)